MHSVGVYRTHRQEYSALLIGLITFSLLGVFGFVLSDIIWYGMDNLSWEYIFQSPVNAGRAGGIGPIIVSTAMILFICLVVTIPVGLGTAIFLAEYLPLNNIIALAIRRTLDILAGVPSIVLGLFGNAFFCIQLGLGFSILSGGLTLACMVLPVFIRASEDGFRSISDSYRHNSLALGLSKRAMIQHVLFPMALPTISIGLSLSVGRALAETAALIFTSGYVDRMPQSILESGRALSVHIFDLSMNVPGGDRYAYSAAFVLVLLILTINLTTHYVMRYYMNKRIVTA